MDKAQIVAFLIITTIVIAMFFTIIVYFIIEYRKRKIIHTKEKGSMKEEYQRNILATQLEIQTQTMQHIGREIHDNVGQKLTLASLYTQQLAYENKAPQITGKIENISNIINESLAELRQLSKSLTDDTINDHSLSELLKTECDKLNALNKCKVVFSNNEKNMRLPYQTKSIVYRVVQEFLQNSIKHAECSNIYITLHVQDAFLHLTLRDDGKGFDTLNVKGNGIGLHNMKKRVELISASYQLQSTPQNGTQLIIAIKL
jgi:signal transduction histidine kinase